MRPRTEVRSGRQRKVTKRTNQETKKVPIQVQWQGTLGTAGKGTYPFSAQRMAQRMAARFLEKEALDANWKAEPHFQIPEIPLSRSLQPQRGCAMEQNESS